MELGELGKSIKAMRLADSLSEAGGLVHQQTFGYQMLAWAYGSAGAVQTGRPYYIRARDTDTGGAPAPLRAWSHALLAMFEVLANDLLSAESHIGEAEAGLDLADFTFPTPAFVMLARGQLALALGDWDRTIVESDEMIEVLTKAGARTFLPDALYFKGRALLAQGRTSEARESLAEASALAEQIGARRSHWQILGTLSQLDVEAGRGAEAEVLRNKALDTVMYIAERTGSDELRASFLTMPDVRAVVGDSEPV